MDLVAASRQAVEAVARWEGRWEPFATHPSVAVDAERAEAVLGELAERLRVTYPFFHPSYAGQMLKPPHPVAAAAYLMAMLVNSNNHALDGGPATSALEREAVAEIAAMLHLPGDFLGHLTSSGTIANLEALFVARELRPDAAIAFSEEAHYTHARMCHLLGVRAVSVAADARGRLDLDALERVLRGGGIGTVVLTAGTTALGAVDAIDEALALRDRYGVRLHVDAAYGGFYAIPAWGDVVAGSDPARSPAGRPPSGGPPPLTGHSRDVASAPGDSASPPLPRAALRAISRCDSVAIDPHKHGLQPYGCGCVLFRDASVGCFYRHDSPYTYFTSGDLHLGEVSLECSRAGAAAAALWATLRLLPLTESGLGAVLAACRRAALRFASAVRASSRLALHQEPDLDIVTFFPWRAGMPAREVDGASQALYERAAAADPPIHLSVARVGDAAFRLRHPHSGDAGGPVRVLRSVLMKPEHEEVAGTLVERLDALAG